MGTSPIFLASFRTQEKIFGSANAVNPQIIWTAGSVGSRLHAINVTSGDNSDNSISIYSAKQLTLGSAMGVGTLVDGAGGDDTITRTNGSFVSDGWKVGDRLWISGPTTLANEFLVILTGVSALTLTFATATIDTGEVLLATSKLMRANLLGTVDAPATAGTVDTVPSVDLLDPDYIPVLDIDPEKYLILGASAYLLAKLNTALDAGESVDVVCFGGDY